MKNRRLPIGVIDGGVGGFTVLKELINMCPNEEYIYCGDSVNTPYSMKSKEENVRSICQMLDFCKEKDVKMVVIACNAISSLVEEYRTKYDFTIIDIISAAADKIARMNINKVMIFSTVLTDTMGLYPKKIREINPQIKIDTKTTSTIPMLLNNGPELSETLTTEINACLDEIEKEAGAHANVVLACTHFPLVQEYMEQQKPNMTFLNPAVFQAKEVQSMLSGDGNFKLSIYTNGEKRIYEEFLLYCGMAVPYDIYQVNFAK